MKRTAVNAWLKRSRFARVPLMGYRAQMALSSLGSPAVRIARWTLTSREYTNFTYDLDDRNRTYLAHFLAVATGRPVPEMLGYFAELEGDERLRAHIRDTIRSSVFRGVCDEEPRYGRRLGWYALVRATKPGVVVETGVDKGLGSCTLAAALLRNAEEGKPGAYFGLDINPDAGLLFRAPYDQAGRILYGDSLLTLRAFDRSIDLFVNDSDHSVEHEAREYQIVADKLTKRAFVIGDNAHTNTGLAEFAEASGRKFLFFKEQPKDHWYGGAGIGLAFP
ncbi:MAG: class I SAM-dependent methyltransferase [Polyangiales bacterium]